MGAGTAAAPLASAEIVFPKNLGVRQLSRMKTMPFTYWSDGDAWLGYVDEFPDCGTQGESLDDLKEHLADLYRDLTSGEIPCVRRHGELELA